MQNRMLLLSIGAMLVAINLCTPTVGTKEEPSAWLLCTQRGVVDKAPGETFEVEIAFRNTGRAHGTWSINIALESESWSWEATSKILTLKPCQKETLTWKGTVPRDAPTKSTARLVVYYNDSFEALDWWVNVVDGAELTITSSTLK